MNIGQVQVARNGSDRSRLPTRDSDMTDAIKQYSRNRAGRRNLSRARCPAGPESDLRAARAGLASQSSGRLEKLASWRSVRRRSDPRRLAIFGESAGPRRKVDNRKVFDSDPILGSHVMT